MKCIAIYYRVSTDFQDLRSQTHAVEGWLQGLKDEQRPHTVKIFKDEGISGKTASRPGYQNLLKAAFAREFDTVVVYRLDRMSRSANEAIRTLLMLDELGVGFISVSQPVLNLGHQNPFRRTMLSAFAELAEIERETIVARVRSGLAAAKKRGVKLGAPIKSTAEDRAKVVSLRASGLSFRKIAEEMKLSYGAVYNLAQDNSETSAESKKPDHYKD